MKLGENEEKDINFLENQLAQIVNDNERWNKISRDLRDYIEREFNDLCEQKLRNLLDSKNRLEEEIIKIINKFENIIEKIEDSQIRNENLVNDLHFNLLKSDLKEYSKDIKQIAKNIETINILMKNKVFDNLKNSFEKKKNEIEQYIDF
ncbi:MAG: hypothetical protein ACTSQE_13080 [Candidatus Heimdallarchaeaceae archaeon]